LHVFHRARARFKSLKPLRKRFADFLRIRTTS